MTVSALQIGLDPDVVAYGSPDFARDVAMRKIEARLAGVQMASEELGV